MLLLAASAAAAGCRCALCTDTAAQQQRSNPAGKAAAHRIAAAAAAGTYSCTAVQLNSLAAHQSLLSALLRTGIAVRRLSRSECSMQRAQH